LITREDAVDLWDLTKLLLRRWYVAAPLLLLSILGVVLAAQSVGPDYKAKGYVQIIPPPSAGRQEDPATKLRTPNPWMDLGYQALANAALLQVTDQTTLEAIAAKGLSESVTVTLGERTQLLEIEAIGATPAQASQTVQEVIRLIEEVVLAQQQTYHVAVQDTIRTRVLNDGSGTDVVTSKIKRVLIVAAAVGILLTTGLTIGFDSLLRRRAERRLLRGSAGAGPVRSAAAPRPAGINGARGSSTPQATAPAPADAGGPTAARTGDNDETQVFNIGMGGLAGPPRPVAGSRTRAAKAANGTRPTVDAVEFKEQAKKPVPPVQPDPDATVVQEAKSVEGADSTIILPLSGASWAKRPPKKR
jgi:capsular polysaccharide biosynthesis protein